MKQFSLLLLLLTVFVSQAVKSQNANRLPRIHERMLLAKLAEIKVRLNLEPALFEKFRPVYIRYESEITTLDFRKMSRLQKVVPDSLTTEEADQLIVNQLETAGKLIEIRSKYYKEFRKVISPQQIIKLYQTEADLRKNVMDELKRRMIGK